MLPCHLPPLSSVRTGPAPCLNGEGKVDEQREKWENRLLTQSIRAPPLLSYPADLYPFYPAHSVHISADLNLLTSPPLPSSSNGGTHFLCTGNKTGTHVYGASWALPSCIYSQLLLHIIPGAMVGVSQSPTQSSPRLVLGKRTRQPGVPLEGGQGGSPEQRVQIKRTGFATGKS